MQEHLEKQVAETAAIVTEWKGTIAKIEAQFVAAGVARANATKTREAHALQAAMGDAAAVAAIKHARSEQFAAEQTIGDLKVALPEAEAHLVAAEKAAASARHELAMLHGEKMMRQRIAAAARMDAAFAECAAAYVDFERLGRELQSFPDLGIAQSGNMSHWETVTGFRRFAAALPVFFLKLFPGTWTNEAARTPLAQSEARFWNLPPEQPEKAKAA
jgi:prophage DNA circulation protein